MNIQVIVKIGGREVADFPFANPLATELADHRSRTRNLRFLMIPRGRLTV